MRESFTSPTGTTTSMECVTVDHTDSTLTPAHAVGMKIRGESFSEWRVIRETAGQRSVHLVCHTEAECDAAMDECKRQNDAFARLYSQRAGA